MKKTIGYLMLSAPIVLVFVLLMIEDPVLTSLMLGGFAFGAGWAALAFWFIFGRSK